MKEIISFNVNKKYIRNANDIFKKIKKINIDYSQENVILFCLNTQEMIISVDVIFKGGLDLCILDERIIYRKALLNNAAKIIVAHNHPSVCTLEPSEEDIKNYNLLLESGKIIDILFLDSIVFNEKRYVSMNKLSHKRHNKKERKKK